jgi:hypothetical protein
MENNAKFIIDDFNLEFLGKDKEKVVIIRKSETKRKLGIIDNNFAFEFTSILNKDAYDYIGYITTRQNNSTEKDYISIIKEELQQFLI